MTTTMIALSIAIALPYLITVVTAYFRVKQLGSFDLNEPRKQAALLEGVGLRMVAAQANAWEALAVFVATLVLATMANVNAATIDTAALIFILGRIAHPLFYAADIAKARALCWAISLGACIWLIVEAFKV